jgi:peptide/nickel transport system permease protein
MRRPLRGGLGLGLVLLGTVTAMALLAGVLAPIDPLRTGATPLQQPSRSHLLGTDDLGRDLWSNIVYGARVSLVVGVLATLLATAAGVIVGMVAGYYGRGWDEGLMRAAEVFQIMPAMLIALLLVALFGGQLWTLVLVIAFTGWPMIARVVRSEILSLREREFVLAARALGGRDARIVWRHLLPNAFAPILINLPMQIGRAILLEAGLSFLGVGNSETSWGRLLQSAQEHMRDAWWLALFPGAALTVTVLGLYQVAEGLHAASIARVHRTGPVAAAFEVFMEASSNEQGSRSPR